MILTLFIYQNYLFSLMINHNILRFDVSVHDTQRVTIMKPLENLIKVVFALLWLDDLQKLFVLYGINMLKHQTMR
jgi:hypothetical protein